MLESKSNILGNSHMRKESIGLKHHVYGALVRRYIGNIDPINIKTTRCRFFKASKEA